MEMKIYVFLLSSFLLISLCSPAAYKPVDSIFLSCGAPKNDKDSQGRTWLGDVGNKVPISTSNSDTVRAEVQDASLPSQVPYMSARIFTSNSSYDFKVSADTKHYLRLHFYPSVYNDLIPQRAIFAVSVAGVTLLRNFSAYITAQVGPVSDWISSSVNRSIH